MFASVRAGEHFAPLVAVCKASSVKARCTSNGTPSALNAGGGREVQGRPRLFARKPCVGGHQGDQRRGHGRGSSGAKTRKHLSRAGHSRGPYEHEVKCWYWNKRWAHVSCSSICEKRLRKALTSARGQHVCQVRGFRQPLQPRQARRASSSPPACATTSSAREPRPTPWPDAPRARTPLASRPPCHVERQHLP